MEFMVNGKVFNNYDEAKRYEKELERNLVNNDYRVFLKNHIDAYTVNFSNGDVKNIIVITDSDKRLYVLALCNSLFGSSSGINKDKQLVKNYSIKKIDTNEIDNIINHLVNNDMDKLSDYIIMQNVLFEGKEDKTTLYYIDTDDSTDDNEGEDEDCTNCSYRNFCKGNCDETCDIAERAFKVFFDVFDGKYEN